MWVLGRQAGAGVQKQSLPWQWLTTSTIGIAETSTVPGTAQLPWVCSCPGMLPNKNKNTTWTKTIIQRCNKLLPTLVPLIRVVSQFFCWRKKQIKVRYLWYNPFFCKEYKKYFFLIRYIENWSEQESSYFRTADYNIFCYSRSGERGRLACFLGAQMTNVDIWDVLVYSACSVPKFLFPE